MKKVLPMYEVPFRKEVNQFICSKFNVLSFQVKKKLSLIENITLTTDAWTDTINTKSFLGMTAAHYLTVSKSELESVTLGNIEFGEHHASDNIIE